MFMLPAEQLHALTQNVCMDESTDVELAGWMDRSIDPQMHIYVHMITYVLYIQIYTAR